MKRKRNVVKIISVVVFAVLAMVFSNHVKAETIRTGDYVGKVYMKKVKDGRSMYLRSQWVLRSDGQFVYCLEPWKTVSDGEVYVQADATSYNELSKEQMDKIILLAYYGYGYEGHEDENWYTITQLVIWQTVDPAGDFFFTDGLNGPRQTLYESEMAELRNLVEEHYKMPSFANKTYTASIGKDFTVVDDNNVLNKFKLNGGTSGVRLEGNSITLSSNEETTKEIELVKNTNKYDSVPFVYSSANSQNVMRVGNFTELKTHFNVVFKSGQINLTKKAKEDNYNDKISLQKAEYQVYDEDDRLVGTIVTDENGQGSLQNLPFGRYKIKESKPSYGYALDPQEYTVEINEGALIQDLEVYEELDKKEVKINKQFLDAYTEEFKPEEGIYFDVYTEDGQTLVGTLLTDKDGNGSVMLPYGTYLVKQRNSHTNYYKVADFTITIDENTDFVQKELINYPKIRIVPKKEIVEVPVEVPVVVPVEVEKEVVKIVEVPNTGKNTDFTIVNYLLMALKLAFVSKWNMI